MKTQQGGHQADGRMDGRSAQLAGQIHEHMDVLSDSGERIGRVDSIEGDRIKLTRAGSEDGQHHYVSCSDVASIKNDQVRLNSGARAMPGNDGS